jgi:hypothetical protein
MEDTALSGTWWRWTKYELRRGYLRKGRGATLERYFPLDRHQHERGGQRGRTPPYASLIRLSDRLSYDGKGGLDAGSTAAIVNWCNEHGLLGVLLHEVQEARFAPRWERARPASASALRLARDVLQAWPASGERQRTPERTATGRRRAGPQLYLTQAIYTRSGAGTVRFGEMQRAHGVLADKTARRGAVAGQGHWTAAQPVVHLHKLATDEWATEPLTTTWARYFPDVPAAERAMYAYPAPYSTAFWRLYAEPMEDFVLAADRLRKAILAAARFLDSGDELADAPVGPQLLNAIVAPAGPALLPTDDGYEQRLVSPSLLGSLALMAQLDLAGRRRIIRCRNDKCRQLVVASNYQTLFCSARCKYAVNKRVARGRTSKRR